MADSQSRKWQITINNPIDKGFTHVKIKELLGKIKSCVYWCMSDEIGLLGETFHTHIFIACSSAVRFSTLLKKFEGAHFEMAKGTSEQNREYVFKLGKWVSTAKEETNIRESHAEWGDMPIERQGKRNDLDDLYDMIKAGLTNYEIVEQNPQYMFNIDQIERTRQTVIEERYKDAWRDLTVSYVYGETGAGKTRGIMDKYGYSTVYRVTDYEHPFDGYKGQNVIVFEEFRSNIRIGDMLNYLDGYPVELRCRYANKIACYTKVYIVSNIPLQEQYTDLQTAHQETWKAFLRRIHRVKVYQNAGVKEYSTHDYLYGFIPCKDGEKIFNRKER